MSGRVHMTSIIEFYKYSLGSDLTQWAGGSAKGTAMLIDQAIDSALEELRGIHGECDLVTVVLASPNESSTSDMLIITVIAETRGG